MQSKNSFISVWPDPQSLAEAAAHYFITSCHESIALNGKFIAALSGGHTPEIFNRLLASPAYSKNIPWHKIHLFWSDERWVDYNNADSNFKMTKDSLLDFIPIPPKNIHPVPVSGKPAAGAVRYEQTIRRVFGNQKPVFDWLMLGLGNDGHTASLFPGTPVLLEKKRLVSEVFVTAKNSWRISFTYPLINRAAKVILLVSGKEKAGIISQLAHAPARNNNFPVSGVHPSKGIVSWMLDQDAASLM